MGDRRQYGLQFDQHDDRYGRTAEWLEVVDGLWTQTPFTHDGARYQLKDAICEPKPVASPRPVIYAGGESDAAKAMIAERCDAYVMHGDEPAIIAEKIADMRGRRERLGLRPMTYGMARYAIVRETAEEADAEVERITTLDPKRRVSPTSTNGSPAPSWSASLRSRSTASPTAACAQAWWGRRPRCAPGWPNSRPQGSSCCCCR